MFCGGDGITHTQKRSYSHSYNDYKDGTYVFCSNDLNNMPKGVTYTIWGRPYCYRGQTLYSGVIGGNYARNSAGGAINCAFLIHLCITNIRQVLNKEDLYIQHNMTLYLTLNLVMSMKSLLNVLPVMIVTVLHQYNNDPSKIILSQWMETTVLQVSNDSTKYRRLLQVIDSIEL